MDNDEPIFSSRFKCMPNEASLYNSNQCLGGRKSKNYPQHKTEPSPTMRSSPYMPPSSHYNHPNTPQNSTSSRKHTQSPALSFGKIPPRVDEMSDLHNDDSAFMSVSKFLLDSVENGQNRNTEENLRVAFRGLPKTLQISFLKALKYRMSLLPTFPEAGEGRLPRVTRNIANHYQQILSISNQNLSDESRQDVMFHPSHHKNRSSASPFSHSSKRSSSSRSRDPYNSSRTKNYPPYSAETPNSILKTPLSKSSKSKAVAFKPGYLENTNNTPQAPEPLNVEMEKLRMAERRSVLLHNEAKAVGEQSKVRQQLIEEMRFATDALKKSKNMEMNMAYTQHVKELHNELQKWSCVDNENEKEKPKSHPVSEPMEASVAQKDTNENTLESEPEKKAPESSVQMQKQTDQTALSPDSAVKGSSRGIKKVTTPDSSSILQAKDSFWSEVNASSPLNRDATTRLVRVIAPIDLPENTKFDAKIDKKIVQVVVPKGGVKQGQKFLSPIITGNKEFPRSSSSSSSVTEASLTLKKNESTCSTTCSPEFIRVLAPESLPAGYKFDAELNDDTYEVCVPKGGVEAGEIFTSPAITKSVKSYKPEINSGIAIAKKKANLSTDSTHGQRKHQSNPIFAVGKNETNNEKVTVVAPDNLPAGHEFEAELDNQSFRVTVPPGGVSKGQAFTTTISKEDKPRYALAKGFSDSKKIKLSVVAPDTLPEGYAFDVEMDNETYTVTVPVGGVHKGQVFTSFGILKKSQSKSFSHVALAKSFESGKIKLTVAAPDNLPEGYEFEAEQNNESYIVTVPKGGVYKGQIFSSFVTKVDPTRKPDIHPQTMSHVAMAKTNGSNKTPLTVVAPDSLPKGCEFEAEFNNETYIVTVPSGGVYKGQIFSTFGRKQDKRSTEDQQYRMSHVAVAKMNDSDKTKLTVAAPDNLPEGHEFEAVLNNETYIVTVPKGGVYQGQIFSSFASKKQANKEVEKVSHVALAKINELGRTKLTVAAPDNLPEGYEFEADLDDETYVVTVPKGGVHRGQVFTSFALRKQAEETTKKKENIISDVALARNNDMNKTKLTVAAPDNLPEGYEFEADLNNETYIVTVPKGGVYRGQVFTSFASKKQAEEITKKKENFSDVALARNNDISKTKLTVAAPDNLPEGYEFEADLNNETYIVTVPKGGVYRGQVFTSFATKKGNPGDGKIPEVALANNSDMYKTKLTVAAPDNLPEGHEFEADLNNETYIVTVPKGGVYRGQVFTSFATKKGNPEEEKIPEVALANNRDMYKTKLTVAAPDNLPEGCEFEADLNNETYIVTVPKGGVYRGQVFTSYASKKQAMTLSSTEILEALPMKSSYDSFEEEVVVRAPANLPEGFKLVVRVDDEKHCVNVPKGGVKKNQLFNCTVTRHLKIHDTTKKNDAESEKMTVRAPCTLPEGASFQVELRGNVYQVVVPKNGVKKGQYFTADTTKRKNLAVVSFDDLTNNLSSLGRNRTASDGSSSSHSQSKEKVTVFAPENMSAGQRFEAELNGRTFMVEVPKGGVKKGQLFTSCVFENDDISSKHTSYTTPENSILEPSTRSSGFDTRSSTKSSVKSLGKGKVSVVAPSDLPEGFRFEAELNGKTFTVEIPKGGVKRGDLFVSPILNDNSTTFASSGPNVMSKNIQTSFDYQPHRTSNSGLKGCGQWSSRINESNFRQSNSSSKTKMRSNRSPERARVPEFVHRNHVVDEIHVGEHDILSSLSSKKTGNTKGLGIVEEASVETREEKDPRNLKSLSNNTVTQNRQNETVLKTPRNEKYNVNVPTGSWRDSLFHCFNDGLEHPMLCNSLFFPHANSAITSPPQQPLLHK